MAIVSSGNLDLLRSKNHKTRIFASFHNPDTLWTAQITGSPSRGESTLSFNNGSGSLFALVEQLQEVLVGASVNDDSVGRLRIRSISSGDGGVTGTLTISHNNVIFSNGQWLTFKLDYPLKPLWPKITTPPLSANFLKDFDITYTDENENLKPIVIAGGNRAGFIDLTLGYFEINPSLNESYSIHPSSSISTYSATALPSTGVTISINGGTGVGTIRFATSGQYWIKYTITDANSTTQNSYRLYIVHDNDPTSSNYPFHSFTVNNINGDWERGGWVSGLTFHDNATLSDFPDRVIAIVWQDEASYDGTETGITFTTETDSSTLISGYLRKETLSTPLTTNLQTGSYSIETIDTLLKNQFMYSISLEAKNTSPNSWYEFRNELTCGRAVHHLWKWHSTLMEICDVVGLNNNTDLRAFAELENGTLYSMADGLLRNTGIRRHVIADRYGRISISPDLQLLPDAERSSLTQIFQIVNLDKSEEITINRQVPLTTVIAKTSGFSWGGSFITTATELCPDPPCPDVDAYCATQTDVIATDEGAGIVTLDRQTFRSPDGQTHANEIAGRLYAKANNPLKELRMNFHGNYSGVLDIYISGYYQYTLQQTDNVRGINFTDKKLFLKNVETIVDVAQGTVRSTVVFEPDVNGDIGVPDVCKDETPSENGETPDPPVVGQYEPLITGSSVEYYSNKDWSLRTASQTLDLRKDPFWKVRQGTSNPLSSIIWRGKQSQVLRSVDSGINWIDITPSGSPPNDVGDSPAPTTPGILFRHMSMSHVNQGEAVFLGTWLNSSNEWRTWIIYTNNDGASWTWQYIQGGAGSITPSASQIWETIASNQGNKSLVALNATCLISVRANVANNVSAFLYSRVGVNITVQDNISFGASNLGNSINLTSTQFLIARVDFATGAKLDLGSTTICTTLSNDNTLTIAGTSTVITPFVSRVDDSTCVMFTDNGAAGLWINVIDISLGVLSLSSSFQITTSTGSTPRGIDMFDDNTGVVYYQENSGGVSNVLKAFTLTPNITGASVAVINTAINGASNTGDPKVLFLAGGLGAVTWTDTLGNNSLRAFKLTGTVISLGTVETPTYITAGNYDGGVLAQGDSNTFYFHTNNNGNTVNDIRSYDIDITTLTLTDNGDEVRWFSFANLTTPYGFLLVDNNLPAVIYDESNIGYIRFFTVVSAGDAPPLGNSIEGLGIDIDRINADKAVITLIDDTSEKLHVLNYDLPALTLNNGNIIGTGISKANIDTRKYYAFPITDWFDTNTYHIFGRYYDPSDLVTIRHMMTTTDNGNSYTSQESSFDSDHIGAVYQTLGNQFIMIRNASGGLSSKVYYQFILKSTLPFNAGVYAHGIAVNDSLVLYTTANVPQSYMVSRLPYPYTKSYNITFDHGISNDIMSIEHLQ